MAVAAAIDILAKEYLQGRLINHLALHRSFVKELQA
jgi:hypothetical protein